MPADSPSFQRHGPAVPDSPVVLSVPHAGRDYPPSLRAALRVPLAIAAALEDRDVDLLALAARRDETVFVATRARAWIDLNRAETERDPRVDGGAASVALPLQSAKLRSGLGLVPRRAGGSDLWRYRFPPHEMAARIADDHAPYHRALGEALATARARFGVAVLLDIHSMPPLTPVATAPRLVIGDRFGRSAAGRLVTRIEAEAEVAGVRTATNTPYAGGFVLDRHGDPERAVHAIQIEFDRALYLNAGLAAPGAGFDATAALLRRLIDAVADEALEPALRLAAE